MNTSVGPVLKFYKKDVSSSNQEYVPITSEYDNNVESWENNRTVIIHSKFIDKDIAEIAMVKITSAKSSSGVLQKIYGVSKDKNFEIDTVSPIPLISLTPENVTFTSKTQTITLEYFTDMNTEIKPVIKYNYKDTNYDIDSEEGVWDSNKRKYTLEFTYPENLAGNYVMIAPKDGARSLKGNSSLFSKTKNNSIDTIPVIVTPTPTTGGGRRIYNIPEPVEEETQEPEVTPEPEVEEETPILTPTPQEEDVETIIENPQVIDEPAIVIEEPQNEVTTPTPLTGFATFFNKKGTTAGLVVILLALLGYLIYRFTTKTNVKNKKKNKR